MGETIMAPEAITTHVLVVLLMLSCFLAALLEFACMRDGRIPDNEFSLLGRRLLIVGLLINAFRLAWNLYLGNIGNFQLLGLTSQLLIVLACIVRCANRIWVIDQLAAAITIQYDSTGLFNKGDLGRRDV